MWKLAESTLGQEDLDALADWLRAGPRLTQGVQVRAFEHAWSEWLGVEHAVMVTSGSTANFALLAVAARRVGRPRPRTGVAAVTWSTNVTPALMLGHEVAVFDIDSRTLGVSAERACAAMDRGELDILFVTHLLGFNALTDDLVDTAARNGVVLLEDCCEAHGARSGDRRVGSIGLGSTFSFYFGHHMSTIEGGMVCTNDADLADSLRMMRSHGLSRESRRHGEHVARNPEAHPQFLFVEDGLNFRSTELNAFLGLRQLPLLDERIAHRNRMLELFLATAPDDLWTAYDTDGVSSFALPLIARDEAAAGRIRAAVTDLGIEQRPVVAGNLLRQPFLAGRDLHVDGAGVSVADHVHACGLYVGNGHHVSEEQVEGLSDRLHQGVGVTS